MLATRFRLLLLPVLGAFALAIWSAPGRADTPVKTDGVPHFGHVFVIIGENTEIGQVNKTNSPYLIGTVKPQAAWLTNYFAVTHFSESNYSAMTSGQYTHCQQFDGSIASCHQNVDNIFSQLDTAGPTWKSWMESMPTPCQVTSAGDPKTLNHYAPKHNPATFYDHVEGLDGVWSADPSGQSEECKTRDIPAGTTGPNNMDGLNAALASGDVADFNYIVPNECEDGHDNCAPQGNGVRQFDAFLRQEVKQIMNSPAFGSDGVLIITYDEGTSNKGPGSSKQFNGGGNVIFAVLSPLANHGTFTDAANHYSFLRTLEDGFGITTYAGHANEATPINSIWR